MIFIDTPGIHTAQTPLGVGMVNTAREVLAEVDVVLLLIEADNGISVADIDIVAILKGIRFPVILVINKIDLVRKEQLLPLMDAAIKLFPFKEIIPVCALTGFNFERLENVIINNLPEGPALFPEDVLTDVSERFIAAEIIREKLTLLTHKEVPYASAVTVESFREDEARNLIRIQATIQVEKESQKAIIIGKKGSKLKEIGTRARLDMEKFFAAHIYLELFVRTRKDWTSSEAMLEELGYSSRKGKTK